MRYWWFFLLTFPLAYGAELPPNWRFEYNYGQATTEYTETQPSIVFNDTDVIQIADFHQFIWQYYLVPPWLDISIGGNITGATQVQEPEEEAQQFQYLTGFANAGVVLPFSDYWHTKLVFEYFYTSMIVDDDAFGFRNLRGTQIYPEVEWLPFGSDMFIKISPYFRVPLFSDIGNRQETTVGLKLSIPVGSRKNLRFPLFAYGKYLTVKVFYTQMKLTFEREGFIPSDIEVRQYGATIGFNF